ncbi:hypothetical protein Abr02nite_71760 [Paractinoplanes brasiliensis]|nr:hypothetical protein Abr02nite_71760 [Actinoplanes brasiliensis]
MPISLLRSGAVRRLFYDRRIPPGPLGRLIRARLARRAGPLIRQTESLLRRAGVRRAPRVAGIRDGRPQLADGRAPVVNAVVWCTGFRPAYGWMDPAPWDRTGGPHTYVASRTRCPASGTSGCPSRTPSDRAFSVPCRAMRPTWCPG